MIDHDVDPLLGLRKRLEGEIANLLEQVAIRKKAIESVTTTINLLRGATPEEELVPKKPAWQAEIVDAPKVPAPVPALPKVQVVRHRYDTEAIHTAMLEFGSELNGRSFPLKELSGFLIGKGLLDPNSRQVCDTTYRYVNSCGLFHSVGTGVYAVRISENTKAS